MFAVPSFFFVAINSRSNESTSYDKILTLFEVTVDVRVNPDKHFEVILSMLFEVVFGRGFE